MVNSGPILHIDLDAFFASVEQRDHPSLRGKPIAVGGPGVKGADRFRGVISTASYQARKFGVHSGLPIFKALKLCPQLIIIPGNFAKYETAHREFSQICSAYSPLVEPLSIDELYLDLSGTAGLWGSPLAVAQNISQQVKQKIGVTCSIGISWQKTCAKVASGWNKPDGITVIPPGWEAQFLASLPVKALPGCGHATATKLAKLSILTVADLASASPLHINLLFGKPGLYLWQVAAGQDPAQVTPLSPAKSISRSTTLPQNTSDKKLIKSTLHLLVDKIAQELRRHHLTGKTISVTVRTASFANYSKSCTLLLASNSTSYLFREAWQLVQNLLPQTEKIRLIGVSISQLNPSNYELELDKNAHSLDKAIDHIRSKFGFFSLYPADLMQLDRIYTKTSLGFNLFTPSLSR